MSLWKRNNTPPSELEENISNMDNRINNILAKETVRQEKTIELIASENFASDAVMALAGQCLQTSTLKDIQASVIITAVNTWMKLSNLQLIHCVGYTEQTLLTYNHTQVQMQTQQYIKRFSNQEILFLAWT